MTNLTSFANGLFYFFYYYTITTSLTCCIAIKKLRAKKLTKTSSILTKIDKDLKYIQKWVPDFQELTYPTPIVDHAFARERCLKVYKEALQ